MDFDEMRVVWDSQAQRKVYAIDQTALHNLVRKRSRTLGCESNVEEIGMMAICAFLILDLGLEPLLKGTDPHQYVGSALFALVGLHMWLSRRKRLRTEQSFDATLTGDLSRAIFRVESRIRLARNFVWWFLAPAGIAFLVACLYSEKRKSWDDWALVSGSFLLGYAVVEIGLRRSILPVARQLYGLRDKLANEA